MQMIVLGMLFLDDLTFFPFGMADVIISSKDCKQSEQANNIQDNNIQDNNIQDNNIQDNSIQDNNIHNRAFH